MVETTQEKKEAFAQTFLDYQKKLNTYASFKVNNNALCDDLVQDTFIKTWAYLAKGGEIIKMKAFLYHVLNGLIIDEYRKRKTTSLDSLLENGFEPHDHSYERESVIFDGKIAMLLISKLPKTYQKVMHMRYEQELSLEEISKKTGKTKSTTAVHAHRGLEKLRLLCQ